MCFIGSIVQGVLIKPFGDFSPIRLIVLCLLAGAIFGQVPQTLEYQGKLTDLDGIGTNDTLPMTFEIFDDSLAGTMLWQEERTGDDMVPVHKGLFTVQLGEITPLDLEFDIPYWLEVEVEGYVLSPRVKLTSSAYAIRAHYADYAEAGGLDGQVQFNNGGYLGGGTGLIWDYINNRLSLGTTPLLDTKLLIGPTSIGVDGITIWDSHRNGLSILTPGEEGIYIHDLGGIGIDMTGTESATVGIRIVDTETTAPDTGISIINTQFHGINVQSPGYDGLRVVDAGRYGLFIDGTMNEAIRVENAGWEGLIIDSPGADGIVVDSPGRDGLEILGGLSTERGLYIHPHSGDKPDNGLGRHNHRECRSLWYIRRWLRK